MVPLHTNQVFSNETRKIAHTVMTYTNCFLFRICYQIMKTNSSFTLIWWDSSLYISNRYNVWLACYSDAWYHYDRSRYSTFYTLFPEFRRIKLQSNDSLIFESFNKLFPLWLYLPLMEIWTHRFSSCHIICWVKCLALFL